MTKAQQVGECMIEAERLKQTNIKLSQQISDNEAEIENLMEQASKLIQIQSYIRNES